MLTSFVEGLFCCLSSRSSNVVVPVETSEPSADGYEFVEVKPGRVLRVRHMVPERLLVEEPSGQGGLVSCKRKITVYRNGQLYIENLGERASTELKRSGETEPNSAGEVELAEGKTTPPLNWSDGRTDSVKEASGDGAEEAQVSGYYDTIHCLLKGFPNISSINLQKKRNVRTPPE